MRLVFHKDNKTVLHAAFVLWLISESLFSYTVISQVALLLFVGLSVAVVPWIRWPYVLTGYALFAAWSVLNIATGHAAGQSVAMAMTRTVFLCLLFLYGFNCYYRYIGNIIEILKLYKWVGIAFSILCLIGGLYSVANGERMNAFGLNANAIARLAGFSLIIVVYEAQNRTDTEKTGYTGLFVAVLVMTILFTGSRKGLIIPALGVYILVAFRRSGRFFAYTVLTFFAACVVLWLLMNIPGLYRLVGYRVEPVLLFLRGEEIQEASMETRLHYIQLAWEESKKMPFWGYGLDCFRLLRYAYGTYSHSNYFEILYSLGWPGLILYYGPFAYTILRIPSRLHVNREKTVLLTAMLVPFVLCDFLNVTYYTRTALIIPMAVMFSMLREEENGDCQNN